MRKVTLFVIFSFLANIIAFAQTNIISEKEYFANNILNIDPIEGIYDIEIKVSAWAPRIGWVSKTQSIVATIRFVEDDKYVAVALKGDITPGTAVAFIQKGAGNNNYTLTRADGNGNWHTEHIRLSENCCFEISETQNMGNATSKSYQSFMKTYPSQSMYQNAIRVRNEILSLYENAIENAKLEDFTSARNLIKQCESINSSNGYPYDPTFFSQILNTIDKQEEAKKNREKIVEINDVCIYKIGNGNPIEKAIQYQTVGGNSDLKITKITTNSKETIFEFEYTNNYDSGGWCSISPSTYIIDKRTGEKHTMLYAEGIPLSPGKHEFTNRGQVLKFKLVFPAIPTSSYYVDLIEDELSTWRFFNIKVR